MRRGKELELHLCPTRSLSNIQRFQLNNQQYQPIFVCLFVCFLLFFRAPPTAYGGSQARGPIGATAAGLCQSLSNTRSELHLRPTPQLTAMPDP